LDCRGTKPKTKNAGEEQKLWGVGDPMKRDGGVGTLCDQGRDEKNSELKKGRIDPNKKKEKKVLKI